MGDGPPGPKGGAFAARPGRSTDIFRTGCGVPVGFMCSRKDPFRYLFFKFALLPQKPEIWCLLDCLTTTGSGRMLFSGMLPLLKCSEKTCKLVQRMEVTGACRLGVVTANSGARQADRPAQHRAVVELAATVKRAASSMGGKAGWSRLGAYRGREVEAGSAVEPRR